MSGATKRRLALHIELEGSSSSAAALSFLLPCNRKLRSHAHFQLRLRFLGQRRKGGRGAQEDTVRKWLVLLL